MEYLLNISFWIWMFQNSSPAALTRACFNQWRMPGDTHKKTD